MKTYKLILTFLITMLISSCMKDYNERYLFDDHFVEFEEATTKSKAVGKDYVIAIETVKPNQKAVEVQVNLVSAQFQEDQIIGYRVVKEESTAIDGTDYQLEPKDKLLFPAKTSIAKIKILPTSTGRGETILVLQLEGNEMVKPSKNYEKIAVRCIYP